MAEPDRRARILLVEDEAVIALAEDRILSAAGYEIERASTGEEAVALALTPPGFDLVLMDINLGGGIDGGEAARHIRESGGPPVSFLSSRSEEEVLAKTMDSGGLGYIAKGSGDGVLLASVRLALDQAVALRSLSESHERHRLLADNVGDVIWSFDLREMRFTYMSPSITALRGLSVEEALAESLEQAIAPSSIGKVRAKLTEFAELAARGEYSSVTVLTDIYEQPCKDGSLKWIEITTKPILDSEGRGIGVAGVSRDATARVLEERGLRESLADKDRLYQELQHRVKNSLALIVSLLSLQSGSVEDASGRGLLDKAQIRVRAIGLLYEQLYRTRSAEDIDLGAYLPEVARMIVESPLGRRGLRFEPECEEFAVPTDKAVSTGLLLAELVANCVEHAFPGQDGGKISLSLRRERDEAELRLEDDGIGLPEGFSLDEGPGLGSLLVSQLARQLGGSAETGRGIGGKGAGFLVRFPV